MGKLKNQDLVSICFWSQQKGKGNESVVSTTGNGGWIYFGKVLWFVVSQLFEERLSE